MTSSHSYTYSKHVTETIYMAFACIAYRNLDRMCSHAGVTWIAPKGSRANMASEWLHMYTVYIWSKLFYIYSNYKWPAISHMSEHTVLMLQCFRVLHVRNNCYEYVHAWLASMFTCVCVNMDSCEYVYTKTIYMYSTRCISSIDLYVYITYGIYGGWSSYFDVLLCIGQQNICQLGCIMPATYIVDCRHITHAKVPISTCIIRIWLPWASLYRSSLQHALFKCVIIITHSHTIIVYMYAFVSFAACRSCNVDGWPANCKQWLNTLTNISAMLHLQMHI